MVNNNRLCSGKDGADVVPSLVFRETPLIDSELLEI